MKKEFRVNTGSPEYQSVLQAKHIEHHNRKNITNNSVIILNKAQSSILNSCICVLDPFCSLEAVRALNFIEFELFRNVNTPLHKKCVQDTDTRVQDSMSCFILLQNCL